MYKQRLCHGKVSSGKERVATVVECAVRMVTEELRKKIKGKGNA